MGFVYLYAAHAVSLPGTDEDEYRGKTGHSHRDVSSHHH